MATGTSSSPYRLFVGIDIAATTFTATWLEPGGSASRPLTLEQTPQGFANLQGRLLALGHVPNEILVVLEATGS
jgi:transposase